MSTYNRRSVAVAAIIAVVLCIAAPAYAGVRPVPASAAWRMAPCVQADDMLMEPSGETYLGILVLQGWAVQCAPVVLGGGFRIATYPAGESVGYAPGYNARYFGSTAVGAVRNFGVLAVPNTPGEYGVCVLGGESERVSCQQVTVADDTAASSWRLIAPDSPLVDKDVVATPPTGAIVPGDPGRLPGDGDVQPACGTCF